MKKIRKTIYTHLHTEAWAGVMAAVAYHGLDRPGPRLGGRQAWPEPGGAPAAEPSGPGIDVARSYGLLADP